MKMNRSIILSIAITLIIGIAMGGLIFGNKNEEATAHTHTNEDGVWTCSMHPQVKQAEPGKCPFCGMDLIPLNSATSADPRKLVMTPEAMALANIQTNLVGQQSEEGLLPLNGKVKADQRLVHSQTTHFGGRIERLFKNFEGEKVRIGDPIASIYSPDLVAAQEEFLQAKKVSVSNPNLLEAARKKLRYWKISNEQIQEIEEREKPLMQIELKSEFNGIVLNKKVNNGDHLMEGEVLMTIADLSKVWIVFDVYEKDIDRISLGQEISFTRNGSQDNYDAKITFISPKVDPMTRIIEVRADFMNNDQMLKPDMFVKGEIKKTVKQGLTVPRSAVLWTGQRSIVYLKDKDEPAFRMVEIELGERIGDQYVVKSGLNSGDEVVTNGAFTIDAEAQLQGKSSMMLKVNQTLENKPTDFVEIDLGEAPDYQENTDLQFQEQLKNLTLDYLTLKDAMVEGISRNIWNTIPAVTQALEEVDPSLLEGDAEAHWIKLSAQMAKSIDQIQGSSDRDFQRLEFINISNALINALKSYGTNLAIPLYIQFCPMANDNVGASWISKEENIVNPYFGDLMLTCGSIDEIL